MIRKSLRFSVNHPETTLLRPTSELQNCKCKKEKEIKIEGTEEGEKVSLDHETRVNNNKHHDPNYTFLHEKKKKEGY